MAITYSDAVDEVFKRVMGTALTLDPPVEVRYAGVESGVKPDKSQYWMRATSQVVTDTQASLSNVNNSRFYEVMALLTMQLFCPRNVENSLPQGREMAVRLQLAFRMTSLSGELWYRSAKIVELPETAEAYPINITVEYRYKTFVPQPT